MIVELVIEIEDDGDQYTRDRVYWLKQTSLSYRVLSAQEWPEGQSAYKMVRSKSR